MIKNNLTEVFIRDKHIIFYILYVFVPFIAHDHNSTFELIIKLGIPFMFLFLLTKDEVLKILFTFYRLLFIFYFLFFIFYFLANDESSKILANFIFMGCLLIFPGYLLAYLMVCLRYKIFILKRIFFNISIFGTFILPFFGYRSGTINMTYRSLDILLFLLIILQLIVHLYNHFKISRSPLS